MKKEIPVNHRAQLPVHSLEAGSMHINILPLNHTNPYDYKREHRHSYFEIMLISKGGGNQLIDFNRYPLKDDSCYIVFPQQIHLMNRINSSGTIIQFTEDRIYSAELRYLLQQLSFTENGPVVSEHNTGLIEELKSLLSLLYTYHSRATTANDITVTNLLQSFVSVVLAHSSLNDKLKPDNDKKLLNDFYLLLEPCHNEILGVQILVQKLGTTEKKLSAITKKYTGLSPLQLIHKRMILEAKRIIFFEGLSYKEVAFRLGFDSAATFSAFIKSKTGYTPSALSEHLSQIHK